MRAVRFVSSLLSRSLLVSTVSLASVVGVALRPESSRAEEPSRSARQDVSLGALLRGPRTTSDPAFTELRQLHAELSARPARAAAQAVLERTMRAIEAAEQSALQRASVAQVTRKKQIAWALLSLADRLIARADAEVLLREAERRAERAHRKASAAERARRQAEAQRVTSAEEPRP